MFRKGPHYHLIDENANVANEIHEIDITLMT